MARIADEFLRGEIDRSLNLPDPSIPGPPESEPRDPAPKRRGLRRAPLTRTERLTIPIEDVPKMIHEAIEQHRTRDDGSVLLLAAPPGAGKTSELVKLAERVASGGRRVLYAGLNHDLFQDVLAFAQRPRWWYEWLPRRIGDSFTTTCRYEPQIKRWLDRGYDAMSFCSNPRICGWHYINGSCPFHAQRRRPEQIIYIQHQHIALGHPLMDQAALLIGDELPLSALLWRWTIPPSAIVPVDMEPGPVETILRNLRALAQQRITISGPDLLQVLGGPAHVIQVCDTAHVPLTALAYTPELRTAESVEDAPYFHLPHLLRQLRREAEEASAGRGYIHRVLIDASGLTLLLRRLARQLPPQIVWADATGNTQLYERMLVRSVRTVAPDVAMQGRIYQLWGSLNNKGSMLPEGKEAPKIEQIRAQIARIVQKHGYARPAIISYKQVAPDLLPGADHGHFWAERGTNKFQECDCLIVVGAPQPTTPAMLETAAMIYQERMTPFDPTWSVIDQPFEAQPWSYPIGGFWNDPDLQLLLEQFRESELIQAVHRARPLRRAVDVWLLTNVPIRALPVDLVSLHDLFDAPVGVDPYRWPDIVAFAEERMGAIGRVTTAEIARRFGVSRHTAIKWFDALLGQGWREIPAVAGEGRGPRARACVKSYQDLN